MAYGRSRSIVLYNLDLVIICSRSVSFSNDSLIPEETAPGAHRLGYYVDGLTVLDRKRYFPPTRNRFHVPRFPAPRLVTTPT
jgi:hypothetical protein